MIQPHLRRVTTGLRQVLIAAHAPIRDLYFPETGFVSVTHEGVELGIIGREGIVGAAPLLLGSDQSPYSHFIHMEGEGLSIGIEPLNAAMKRSSDLHLLLLRFVHVQLVQTSHTAFTNAAYTIEARLARWLLMCADRVDGDTIHLTHEFLARMLGVQRTGVTMALQMMESSQLIRGRRGRIHLLDRDRLRADAEDSYGLPEAEYERLIGKLRVSEAA